ncbi:MAG: hypothetical protein OEU09_08460 [Rhodospirillales bacterium]|nr:hypothetical protein [Rhodospirillales bacterium]MDH3917392.1 hypothetical protein [Rhodospirillales bacterium]MDH3967333.1 hypothetical protein [Rhodospirillales bacterium]
MYDGSQGNAMTEIALALAMGFFSLLVLAMVSMGAGRGKETSATAAILAPPAAKATDQGTTGVEPQDIILIYFDGGFLDTELRAVEPDSFDGARRIVLAFAPDVPLAEAMTARSRVSAEHLVVSTLNDAWLSTLADLRSQKGSKP